MALGKSGFQIIGESLSAGTYQGVWNGRTISLNGRPWTMIKTAEKVVGWLAVQIQIGRENALSIVLDVVKIPTALEKAVDRVDTRAKTRLLWWPAIDLLRCLGTRVSTSDLNYKTLDLSVLKGNLEAVTNVLSWNQRDSGYQIWAPSRMGMYYHIRIVWPS